jgi:hypothetical protein
MSLIKRGIKAAMAGNGKGGKFLTLAVDVPTDVIMAHELDAIQSVDMHDWWDYTPAPHLVCLGEDCPSCAVGHEARTRSYVGVITREKEVKYLASGAQIVAQLEKYAKALGSISGRLMQFEKTGSGMKTKYSVLSLGKKMNIAEFVLPDLEELLGPLTIGEQVKKMAEVGIDVSKLKSPAKRAGKTTTASAPASSGPEPKADEKLPEGTAPWVEEEVVEAEMVDGWGAM